MGSKGGMPTWMGWYQRHHPKVLDERAANKYSTDELKLKKL